MIDHHIPEELDGLVPVATAFQIGNALVTDNLWNLCIGVLTRQVVLALHQRLQDALVAKLVSQLEVLLVACQLSDVGKRLVQSAVLTDQHLLNLLVTQLADLVNHPVRQLDKHLLGLLTTCNEVGIAQSGIDLVDIIKRYPTVVQSERVGMDVAFGYLSPYLVGVGHTTHIAVLASILTAFQFAEHIVQASTDFLVSCGSHHIAQCRHIVSTDVAVQTRILPVSVVLGLRRQPSPFQIGCQQSVSIQRQEVVDVCLLVFLKLTIGQSHTLDGESLDALCLCCTCRQSNGCQANKE